MARFVKSFSKASRYGHAVGRIMVHEGTLLNWQQVERLVDSDLKEALAVSLETVYGPYLEGSTVAGEIEAGLMRFLADEYRFLDEICAGTLAAEFMHLKYDFHNLRVVLKQHHFGDSGGDELLSGFGSITVEELREQVEEGRSPRVPDFLREVVEGVKQGIVRRGADPQRLDTIIDRAFLERRLKVAELEGSDLLTSFCRAAIDVANLRVLLRGLGLGKDREYYIEALAEGGRLSREKLLELSGEPFGIITENLLESRYGKMLAGVLERGEDRARLTSLDRASDEYLLGEVGRFTVVSVGPERIVRFMLRREDEVAILRIIFMGKLHSLSPEVIEARIPEAYLRGVSR